MYEADDVRAANDAVALALQHVREAAAEVREWNEMIKQDMSNPNLHLFIQQQEKTTAQLREANERLKESREYHLQLIRETRRTAEMMPPEVASVSYKVFQHVLLDAPTTQSSRNKNFKISLMTTYQCILPSGMVRCMLINQGLPSKLVVAAHLFRRSNEFMSKDLMDIADIDDVRNGLLLFKPLEWAFDHFNISFIVDQDGQFVMKVFNPNYWNRRLVDCLNENEQKDLPEGEFDLQTTFGGLDGQPLVFPPNQLQRPFKRCLNLQARLARHLAVKNSWIDPNDEKFEFADFWSEGMSVAEKMDFYFERV